MEHKNIILDGQMEHKNYHTIRIEYQEIWQLICPIVYMDFERTKYLK